MIFAYVYSFQLKKNLEKPEKYEKSQTISDNKNLHFITMIKNCEFVDFNRKEKIYFKPKRMN